MDCPSRGFLAAPRPQSAIKEYGHIFCAKREGDVEPKTKEEYDREAEGVRGFVAKLPAGERAK